MPALPFLSPSCLSVLIQLFLSWWQHMRDCKPRRLPALATRAHILYENTSYSLEAMCPDQRVLDTNKRSHPNLTEILDLAWEAEMWKSLPAEYFRDGWHHQGLQRGWSGTHGWNNVRPLHSLYTQSLLKSEKLEARQTLPYYLFDADSAR